MNIPETIADLQESVMNEAVVVLPNGDHLLARGGRYYQYTNGERKEISQQEYAKLLGKDVSKLQTASGGGSQAGTNALQKPTGLTPLQTDNDDYSLANAMKRPNRVNFQPTGENFSDDVYGFADAAGYKVTEFEKGYNPETDEYDDESTGYFTLSGSNYEINVGADKESATTDIEVVDKEGRILNATLQSVNSKDVVNAINYLCGGNRKLDYSKGSSQLHRQSRGESKEVTLESGASLSFFESAINKLRAVFSEAAFKRGTSTFYKWGGKYYVKDLGGKAREIPANLYSKALAGQEDVPDDTLQDPTYVGKSATDFVLNVEDKEDAEAKNETVITRGSEKWMARGGKYFHYDSQGKRTEISADDYFKIRDGNKASRQGVPTRRSPGAKDTEFDASTKAVNKNFVKLNINGREYTASVEGMTGKEISDKFNALAQHSKGKAIQWLKKNGSITHVGGAPTRDTKPKTQTPAEENGRKKPEIYVVTYDARGNSSVVNSFSSIEKAKKAAKELTSSAPDSVNSVEVFDNDRNFAIGAYGKSSGKWEWEES